MKEDFAKLLQDLIKIYGGTKSEFAAAVGLTPFGLSRYLTTRNATYPVPLRLCLRIARVCEVSASKVLRIGGCADIADEIEALYGAAAVQRLHFGVPRIPKFHVAVSNRLQKLNKQELSVFLTMLDWKIASNGSSSPSSRHAVHPAEKVRA